VSIPYRTSIRSIGWKHFDCDARRLPLVVPPATVSATGCHARVGVGHVPFAATQENRHASGRWMWKTATLMAGGCSVCQAACELGRAGLLPTGRT
jgi:hypothetical protein